MDFVRRVRNAVIIYAISAGLFAVGIGFLVGAGDIATARQLGSLYASLAFGAGFVVLALVIFALYHIAAAIAERRRARERRAAQMSSLMAAVLALLPTLLRSRSGLVELLMPVLTFLAYTIYRENSGNPGEDTPTDS